MEVWIRKNLLTIKEEFRSFEIAGFTDLKQVLKGGDGAYVCEASE